MFLYQEKSGIWYIYYTNSKLYPCTCSFEIYFIDIKKNADELLDFMQVVYDFFKDNVVQTKENGKLITGQKMIYQEQSLHAESNEHVIYVQRYNLLIP